MLDGLSARTGLIAACGYGAFCLRHQTLTMPPLPYLHALLAAVSLYTLSELLFSPPKGWSLFRRGLDAGLRLSLIALILSAAAFALKISDQYSRLWAMYWGLSSWVVLLGLALVQARRRPPSRNLILVGTPEATELVRADAAAQAGGDILCLRPTELLDWLQQRSAEEATLDGREILLVDHVPDQALRTALILALHGSTTALRYCPDLTDFQAGGQSATLPLVPGPGALQDIIKRLEDVLFAAIGLVLCAPVMLIIAVLVRRSGPGPILFHQRRLGLGGRAFIVYKFRTMVPAAMHQAQAPQAENDDARVTGIGRVLRHWGLDELPQLFNVLRGDMSLVGPRPHAFPHDMAWGNKLPNYVQRFRMRPGITGLAQIHGRRGHVGSDEAIAARLELDLQYIRTWSLGLDLRILAQTIPSLIRNAPPTDRSPNQPARDPLGQQRD